MGLFNSLYFKAVLPVGINLVLFGFFVDPLALAESRFDACKPQSCGKGPNISYPFYISGNGTDYCGHPGFSILCQDSRPIYNTSAADYIIQSIDYEKKSFRLVNTDLINSSCPAPQQNYSFDRSSISFSSEVDHACIWFFYNCSNSFSVNYTKWDVDCGYRGSNNRSFASLLPCNKGLNWSGDCESLVAAPIELPPSEANQTINYVKLLKNGFAMKWVGFGYHCSMCRRSGGRCGFDNETTVCYCPDATQRWLCGEGKLLSGWKLGLVIAGGAAAIVILLFVFTFRCWYKRRRAYSISKEDLQGSSVYHGVPVLSYDELEESTNNFDSANIIGDGGFGTVYYGKLRDGREVAVKRLYEHNCRRVQLFMNEVKILACLRHKNLVSLYGCTSRNSHSLVLVYEYVCNGTVADHLHGDRAKPHLLTWPIRMSIAIETATALAYLHASDIIHRDVKTDNILLDKKFSVKVADFGLSRLLPEDVTHISTAPQGTPGYVDPEYHQCYQLTDKSDVYSFGVVLVELLTSLPPVDISRHRHEINLANLAINKILDHAFSELIDPHLGYDFDEEIRGMTTSVSELAFQCLQQDKELRPSMKDVVEELKRIQGQVCRQNQDTEPSISSADVNEMALLKNIQLEFSPNSVTTRWISSSTASDSI